MMLRTRFSAARADFGCDARYSLTELILALAKQMLQGDLARPGRMCPRTLDMLREQWRCFGGRTITPAARGGARARRTRGASLQDAIARPARSSADVPCLRTDRAPRPT